MDSYTTHLSMLIQLALSDGEFAGPEKGLIYMIGKANGIKEKEIDQLVQQHLNLKEPMTIQFKALSEDERFEFLYNIIQLMKIDNEVFLSEIRYCEQMAEKLGYQKAAVREISAKVYGNPMITADKSSLKDLVKKYRVD
ncbi:MAG: TerB family tellurite resistance protein [Cyclobacteriaceae bacterium]